MEEGGAYPGMTGPGEGCPGAQPYFSRDDLVEYCPGGSDPWRGLPKGERDLPGDDLEEDDLGGGRCSPGGKLVWGWMPDGRGTYLGKTPWGIARGEGETYPNMTWPGEGCPGEPGGLSRG